MTVAVMLDPGVLHWCGPERVQVADASSYDEFVVATRRRLLHHLYALTTDMEEAQDVLQEAYTRAWQRWERIRGYDDPEAWVRTVAWRIANNRWHKARNAVRALGRQGVAAPTDEPSPDHVVLVTALRELPPAQREAIVLHHLVGMPVEEIAAHLGAPTGTVKARLTRGRAALAAVLGEDSHD